MGWREEARDVVRDRLSGARGWFEGAGGMLKCIIEIGNAPGPSMKFRLTRVVGLTVVHAPGN